MKLINSLSIWNAQRRDRVMLGIQDGKTHGVKSTN